MDALTILRKVAAVQDGMITLAQARDAGLTVKEVDRLCRTGRWRRLARTAYLLNADRWDGIPRRARIRGAVESLGPGAMAVLATAAELHDIAGLRSSDKVHVSVPGAAARPRRPNDPALVIHQMVIPPSQIESVAGIAVTSPIRTVTDLILNAGRFEAVSILDSALNRGLVTESDLAAVPAMIRGRRGAVAARRHLAEMDGRSQSPLETRSRLRCVDGGVAPDELQHPVHDSDGYLLGVGDMAWKRAKIIGEADGRGPHGTPEALYQDRWRQNRIINAGWIILRFTWADTLRPDYIPYVVRNALNVRLPR